MIKWAQVDNGNLKGTQKTTDSVKLPGNLKETIESFLESLTDDIGEYDPEDFCKYGRAVFYFYQGHKDVFDGDTKKEFDSKIAEISKNNPLRCIREAAGRK